MSFRIFALSVEIVCGIIAFLPFLLLRQFLRRRERNAFSVFLFAAYLVSVFSVTGIPALNTPIFDPVLQCIPFASLLDAPDQYIGNILLFVPLGLFASRLWCYFQSIKSTAALGLGLSIWIEFEQLFTFRTTDIDDVIANTAGAVLGFALWRVARRFLPCAAQKTKKADLTEFFILLFGVYLTMFFFQPLLSNFAWTQILK